MPGAHLVGEVVRVDVLTAQRQPVAVVTGEQHLRLLAGAQARLEHAPHAGDVGVQAAVGTTRRVLAPDQAHQRVGWDVAAEPERQRGEHRARFAGTDVHGGSGIVTERHLARTEHAHPHAPNVAAERARRAQVALESRPRGAGDRRRITRPPGRHT